VIADREDLVDLVFPVSGSEDVVSLPISSWPNRASNKPLAVVPHRYSPTRGYRDVMEKAFWARIILAPVRFMTPFRILRFFSIRASSTT